MPADHERAAGSQARRDAREHVALHRRREVGEGHVAAQHEIEGSVRGLAPQVLEPERDGGAEAIAHDERALRRLEERLAKARRQFACAARREAAGPRALEQTRIGVGRHQREGEPRDARRHVEHEARGEGVGLLAGRAARAPGAQARLRARPRRLREGGQHTAAQAVEDAAVAIEARDRDAAAGVEMRPLLGTVLEAAAVGGAVGQAELGEAAREAPAYLAPDPAVAFGPQAEPRQAEAQQLDALGVRHGAAPGGRGGSVAARTGARRKAAISSRRASTSARPISTRRAQNAPSKSR